MSDAVDDVGLAGHSSGVVTHHVSPRRVRPNEPPGAELGDFERADVGGLGTEDAAPCFLRARLGAPVTLELEDEEEECDVQEKKDEGDFGSHEGRKG